MTNNNDQHTIEILENGKISPFWEQLCKITRENIVLLENQILEKESIETGETLTDVEVDRLRDKRSAMLELLDLPQALIDSIKNSQVDQVDELDPYAPEPRREDSG